MNKPIAEGSFADVFLSNNVIIKRINISKIAKKKQDLSITLIKDYIESEIDLLKYLNHKNVIKYLRYEKSRGIYDVYLEYCKYGDMHSILKNTSYFTEYRNGYGGLSGELLESFIIQISEGLMYLHGQSLIHRDIKPHNILLNENMEFKLADFGFTCCDLGNIELTEYEQHNLTVIERKYFTKSGTPYYIAPEIYKETYTYSCISDLWSLGLTIYELYFNELPLPKFKSLKDLSNHLQIETTELFIHDKIITLNIPKTLKRILTGLLMINPDNRLKIKDILLMIDCESIIELENKKEIENQKANDNEQNKEIQENDQMYSTYIDGDFTKSFIKWLKENEN